MEQNAIITGCVRTNDAEGVTISSHKGILLEAEEEIIINSKTKVAFSSPNQIKMVTPTGGFSMENEIHFNNMKTIIDCADEMELPPVEQPLMQEEKQSYVLNKPGTAENPGVDLGDILAVARGTVGVTASLVMDNSARKGELIHENSIMAIAGVVLGFAACFIGSVPILVGIGLVCVGMAAKTLYNNSQLKEINQTPDGDLVYGINQGIAVVGAFPVLGLVAKGATAAKLLATATIETLELLDQIGTALGFATSGAGAALAGGDELQYDHEQNQKDHK